MGGLGNANGGFVNISMSVCIYIYIYMYMYVHVLFYALAGLFRKKLVKCRPGCPPPVTYSLSQCLLSSSMRSHCVLAPPTFISSVMQHGMYLTVGA